MALSPATQAVLSASLLHLHFLEFLSASLVLSLTGTHGGRLRLPLLTEVRFVPGVIVSIAYEIRFTTHLVVPGLLRLSA
jgi:urease beta subunit